MWHSSPPSHTIIFFHQNLSSSSSKSFCSPVSCCFFIHPHRLLPFHFICQPFHFFSLLILICLILYFLSNFSFFYTSIFPSTSYSVIVLFFIRFFFYLLVYYLFLALLPLHLPDSPFIFIFFFFYLPDILSYPLNFPFFVSFLLTAFPYF